MQSQGTPPCPRQLRSSQDKLLLNRNLASSHGDLWKLCIYFVPTLKNHFGTKFELTNISVSVNNTFQYSKHWLNAKHADSFKNLKISTKASMAAWSVTLNNHTNSHDSRAAQQFPVESENHHQGGKSTKSSLEPAFQDLCAAALPHRYFTNPQRIAFYFLTLCLAMFHIQ